MGARLHPSVLVPVVLPIATIAPIGHTATLPLQTGYSNQFVATHADIRGSVDRTGLPRTDLTWSNVVGLSLSRPTVSAPTIDRSSIAAQADQLLTRDSQASDKIYNAERRLQLAHAINDRPAIARIRAELDRLF